MLAVSMGIINLSHSTIESIEPLSVPCSEALKIYVLSPPTHYTADTGLRNAQTLSYCSFKDCSEAILYNFLGR